MTNGTIHASRGTGMVWPLSTSTTGGSDGGLAGRRVIKCPPPPAPLEEFGFLDVSSAWALNESALRLAEPVWVHGSQEVGVEFVRAFEPHLRWLVTAVFASVCRSGGLFVDSGANDGAWSLVAAAAGCSVLAVEPQPRCTKALRASIRANRGMRARLSVHQHLLSTESTTANISTLTCFGGAQFPGGRATALAYARKCFDELTAASQKEAVTSISLDALVRSSHGAGPLSPLELWHVDTEGAELPVLRSAAGLFAAGLVRRVVMEVVPKRWSEFGLTPQEGLAEAARLFRGWRCRNTCSGALIDWSREVPAKECAPQLRRAGVKMVDVYCVAPKLARAPVYEPGEAALLAFFGRSA